MKNKQRKSNMDGLLVLLLFCVFAVCVLSVLLTSADAYGRLTQRDQASYDRRTAAQYLATRVRQADRQGGVSLCNFEGLDALLLTEEIGGETYHTRIYCYDGYLREMFAAAEGTFAPEDGELVLEAQSLTFDLQDGVLSAQLTGPDGTLQPITLYLRSGEGAAS